MQTVYNAVETVKSAVDQVLATSDFVASETDARCISTIRCLSADMVAKAKSGHPGAPMGLAPTTHILFSRFFNVNPAESKWVNRDRFVLSNGHACALQYSLLHLLGYKDMTLDQLKNFRQVSSITAGHPEAGAAEGIEVTTGPLGQGFANAVGLAMAQAHTAAVFNKPGYELINNHTYVLLGDGCMQEGVAAEAASLAGHLQLKNLIALYDDNHIQIDGDTNLAFTEDVDARFKSYGWNVLVVEDGDNDLASLHQSIATAKASQNKPTMIRIKTIIGFGSLNQGTHGVHGSPLKEDDISQLKVKCGFEADKKFFVPEDVKNSYHAYAERGAQQYQAWQSLFESYKGKFPSEAADLSRRLSGKLPEGWEKALPVYKPTDSAVASRKLSETVLCALAPVIPELIGGSADLTGSNLTRWKDAEDFQAPSTGLGSYAGRYVRYGVREHGMTAIMNGMAAYGTVIPYSGTFLNFVSYAAGALRLAALSHHRVLMVATHDSIGLGEDGPTHQPVETVAHFRALPNCAVWRPADGNETSAAYLVALNAPHTPSVICLSRQNLPQLENSTIEAAAKGGYVVHEAKDAALTLVSTGSEVAITVEAVQALEKKGIKARVVSLPCWEAFDTQSDEYKLSCLPHGIPVMAVEAYSTFGWERFSHEAMGLKAFGASGPYQDLYKHFGLTAEGVADNGAKVVEFYKGKEVISPLRRALSHR